MIMYELYFCVYAIILSLSSYPVYESLLFWDCSHKNMYKFVPGALSHQHVLETVPSLSRYLQNIFAFSHECVHRRIFLFTCFLLNSVYPQLLKKCSFIQTTFFLEKTSTEGKRRVRRRRREKMGGKMCV
jgi:hypothetical protein